MFDRVLSVLMRTFEKLDFNFYPNPVTDKLFIKLEKLPANISLSSIRLRIVDLTGKCAYSREFEDFDSSFDLSEIPRGTYIIQLLYEGNSFKNSKIIIS